MAQATTSVCPGSSLFNNISLHWISKPWPLSPAWHSSVVKLLYPKYPRAAKDPKGVSVFHCPKIVWWCPSVPWHCTSWWRGPQLLHTCENEGSWTVLSWYWGKKLKIWSPQAKNWASECIYGDLINNLGCEHFVSGCMLRHFSVPLTVSHNHRKVLLCWQDGKQTLLETPFIQTTSVWELESWVGLTSFTP